jgi:hypothetical protein
LGKDNRRESGTCVRWRNTRETDEERARESAVALAHIFRLRQTLRLRSRSGDSALFQAALQQADHIDVHKFRYTFRNLEEEELYFAVSGGYYIKQLIPTTDTLRAMPSRSSRTFEFRLAVPHELRRSNARDEMGIVMLFELRDKVIVVLRAFGLSGLVGYPPTCPHAKI